MKSLPVIALVAALALGACAPQPAPRHTALSGAELTALPLSQAAPEVAALAPRYDIREVRVSVPQTLRVSEASLYYPLADIVWRGEPRGDRHAQIAAIFQEAFARGTEGMRRGPAAVVEVEVARFHALTEKTRASVGGVHSIRYDLTVRDAASGAVLEGPRRVVADVSAAGGQRALDEDARGLTQRVVIVHNLALSALRELSAPAEVR